MGGSQSPFGGPSATLEGPVLELLLPTELEQAGRKIPLSLCHKALGSGSLLSMLASSDPAAWP